MTPRKTLPAVTASVRHRLLNLAREQGADFEPVPGSRSRSTSASATRRFAFDGDTLRTAIAETFRLQGTPLTGGRPTALHAGYYDDHEASERARPWREMRRRIGTDIDGPDRLVDAGEELRRFLGPVCDSLIGKRPFAQAWPAGGPWRPVVPARTGSDSDG